MNPDLILKKKKMGQEYKLQILVVDDNPLILMSVSRFLKKIALVKTVSTAEEAIDAIKEQHYDLCFLDVMLPGMTGLDAMKIITELSPNTKVAIMTATLLNEAMKQQVDDNAYTFIEKPFGLSDIEGVVERATVALSQ
ncbi:MAG: response regulator [Desulfobacteraceae bacterium]|jgi:DNA-binding NtrC family response regulator|nr:response regulator [Desulfobacteraceae bacterium]MDH3838910.1 response regulator [Desulfobacteraceae bacterium]